MNGAACMFFGVLLFIGVLITPDGEDILAAIQLVGMSICYCCAMICFELRRFRR